MTTRVVSCRSVARKIPFENPEVLLYVRIAYVTVQVIVIGTYFYVSQKVRVLLATRPSAMLHL